jgi:hypothetical protein
MENLDAAALFTVMAISLEIGILTGVRATLTSGESTKALHVLVFGSPYRFFWIPKLACGLAMIAALTLAFQATAAGDNETIGIAALSLIPVFGGLVFYEAVRTKE